MVRSAVTTLKQGSGGQCMNSKTFLRRSNDERYKSQEGSAMKSLGKAMISGGNRQRDARLYRIFKKTELRFYFECNKREFRELKIKF